MTVLNICSDATGPVVAKFNIEPLWSEGTKICKNGPSHMTNMVAIPVDSKNL